MKLEEYLKENALTDLSFATALGVAPSTISRIRRGETRPDWKTLDLIKRETNGAVTPNDFLLATSASAQEEAAIE